MNSLRTGPWDISIAVSFHLLFPPSATSPHFVRMYVSWPKLCSNVCLQSAYYALKIMHDNYNINSMGLGLVIKRTEYERSIWFWGYFSSRCKLPWYQELFVEPLTYLAESLIWARWTCFLIPHSLRQWRHTAYKLQLADTSQGFRRDFCNLYSTSQSLDQRYWKPDKPKEAPLIIWSRKLLDENKGGETKIWRTQNVGLGHDWIFRLIPNMKWLFSKVSSTKNKSRTSRSRG